MISSFVPGNINYVKQKDEENKKQRASSGLCSNDSLSQGNVTCDVIVKHNKERDVFFVSGSILRMEAYIEKLSINYSAQAVGECLMYQLPSVSLIMHINRSLNLVSLYGYTHFSILETNLKHKRKQYLG